MAATGHADDCAACRWQQLPDEDRAVLDPAAFRNHSREEPPVQPPALRNPRALIALGAGALVFALAWILQAPGGLLLLIGFAWFLCVVGLGYQHKGNQEAADRAWQSKAQTWKEEQTEAWLAARAGNKLWPCPTCGSRSCPNRHSVTKTTGVRVGPFYGSNAHTDGV